MSYDLGIDMGTSSTAAAVLRLTDPQAEPQVSSLGEGSFTVPTVLYLGQDGQVLVGEPAERRRMTDPDRVVRHFKNRLGDPAPMVLAGTPWAVPDLAARLLRWVVDRSAEREGGPARAIAVTHPASWGSFRRELLANAVRATGLGPTFVVEPVAAVLGYAWAERVEPGAAVAVYNLGGGSFEAAVVHHTDSGLVLLGLPEGLERLGGIDFDDLVFEHVREALGPAWAELDGTDPAVLEAVARLRRECTAAKEGLSSDVDVYIPVMLPGLHRGVRLSRAEFEDMIRPAVADTVDALCRAIGSAGLAPEQLSAVLLVGGSSRIPLVSELVSARLGRSVVLDPDPTTIARGAVLALAAQHTTRARAPSVAAAPVSPVPRPDAPLDDDVQFTVYRPASVRPARWYPLLAYAHKTTLIEAPDGELVDPVLLVDRQARQLLQDESARFDKLGTERPLELSRGSEILLEPWVNGGEVEPLRIWLRWTRPVHQAEFTLRVPAATQGQLVDGGLRVFLGLMLIAEVRFQIMVSTEAPPPARTTAEPLPARRFRRIFASYSHRDTDVVRAVAHYATLTGDRYIIDVQDLRTSEPWQPRLAELIEQSDIFQLFWSHNAMESAQVRREWTHALQLGREGFIRPVYWQDPLPADPRRRLPPKKLRELHWSRLDTRITYAPPASTSIPTQPSQGPMAAGPDRVAGVGAPSPRSAPWAGSASGPRWPPPGPPPAPSPAGAPPASAKRSRGIRVVALIAAVTVVIAALVMIVILTTG